MALDFLTSQFFGFQLWIILISTWDLIWRIFAVWKSTKKNQPIWSVAFLIFQTAGILPMLYIFLFSETKQKRKKISSKELKTNISKKLKKK